MFPCCSGPVSLFVSIFASDTFYQGLATRTAEECRVSSCLQIFEIFFCRTSCFPCSSHNLCTGMCSHHLLCSRFRCILCKRAFVSHTVHGFFIVCIGHVFVWNCCMHTSQRCISALYWSCGIFSAQMRQMLVFCCGSASAMQFSGNCSTGRIVALVTR